MHILPKSKVCEYELFDSEISRDKNIHSQICEKEVCKANFCNQDAWKDNEKYIQKYRAAMKQCSALRQENKMLKNPYHM